MLPQVALWLFSILLTRFAHHGDFCCSAWWVLPFRLHFSFWCSKLYFIYVRTAQAVSAPQVALCWLFHRSDNGFSLLHPLTVQCKCCLRLHWVWFEITLTRFAWSTPTPLSICSVAALYVKYFSAVVLIETFILRIICDQCTLRFGENPNAAIVNWKPLLSGYWIWRLCSSPPSSPQFTPQFTRNRQWRLARDNWAITPAPMCAIWWAKLRARARCARALNLLTAPRAVLCPAARPSLPFGTSLVPARFGRSREAWRASPWVTRCGWVCPWCVPWRVTATYFRDVSPRRPDSFLSHPSRVSVLMVLRGGNGATLHIRSRAGGSGEVPHASPQPPGSMPKSKTSYAVFS